MVTTLLIWLYVFFLTSVYGIILHDLAVGAKFIARSEDTLEIELLSLVGLCGITCFLGFYSVFFNVGLYANLTLLLVGALCVSFRFREYKEYLRQSISGIARHNGPVIALAIAFSAIVLLFSLIHPITGDTGLYHAQTIKWIEQYKAVPGLGNLHGRLAYNSHFFLTSALFSFSFLNIQSFHLLNSYLLTLFAFSILRALPVGERNGNRYTLFYALLVIFCFEMFRWKTSSPTPDIASAICVWFIFLIGARKVETELMNVFDFNYVTMFVLIVTVMTMKLSVMPIVLLGAVIIYSCRESLGFRQYLGIGLIGILVISPWLIRNVILSGYLVYPVPSIDLFNVDWKVPGVRIPAAADWSILSATEESSWIRSFARIPGRYYAEVLSLPFSEWFPIWFKAKAGVQQVSFVIASLTSLVVGIAWVFNIRQIRRKTPLVLLWLISFLGFVFWFLTAPEFRFVYSFLPWCILLPIRLFLKETVMTSRYFNYSVLTLLALFWVKTFRDPIDIFARPDYLSKVWLVPEDYIRVETVPRHVNNVTIFLPKSEDQCCWNEHLPCTPYFNDKLELRGKEISDGFRVKQKASSGSSN